MSTVWWQGYGSVSGLWKLATLSVFHLQPGGERVGKSGLEWGSSVCELSDSGGFFGSFFFFLN